MPEDHISPRRGDRAITLVEAPRKRALLERHMRYDVYLYGEYWGDLYFNLRGYCGYLPSPEGALDLGERPISVYRAQIRALNNRWREQSGAPLPNHPAAHRPAQASVTIKAS